MSDTRKFLRRAAGLFLVLALLLPLAGPGTVLEASAVTKAEIDALKGDANDLASQRKDIQNQLKAIQADKNAAINKKELIERRVSASLEDMIENRKSYAYTGTEKKLQPVEGMELFSLVQAPIIAAGDVCGSIMYLMNKPTDTAGETEVKLIAAAASFLGKQMEE